jgi:hypothetical protein
MIEITNLSNETLAKVLQNAYIEHEIDDDGDLYVTGLDFPLWIKVDVTDPSYCKIVFSTFAQFSDEENVDELKALQLANSINSSYMPNQVYVSGGRLCSIYYLLVAETLSEKLFITVMRRSVDSFVSGVRELDEHNLFN